ncbi:hypothetical protein SKAU_G00231310 [Synaphobranchus kaupii]|uniref:Uncharacterized protein n=1 Tax=Synaphobranchus kaupii TaxID=118154 RepID=A0A9Q1ISD8_SYNKA|nr:hypothetical protein SKAU_G00231310 [Synaphobranchus kaupii]
MVGKIKRTRQKFHQGAVKLGVDGEARTTSVSLGQGPAPTPAAGGATGSLFIELSRTTSVCNTSDQIQKHEDGKEKVGPNIFNSPQSSDTFPSSVFAGTKISAEVLVQTLKYEDPPSNVISLQTGQR